MKGFLIALGLLAGMYALAAEPDTQESQAPRSVAPSTAPSATRTNPAPQPSKQSCHPSYSGCLRADASDYDCAGGSGNGPYYTSRVQVVGPDVFGLDRDGDGWGCD